jgi:peptidyl-prolyl cis-trans isomerase B (cyclophilin B)
MLVAALLACSLLLGACGSDDGEKEADGGASAPTATATPEAEAAGCEKASEPKPRKAEKLPKPKTELDPERTYVARVLTSCGEFEITLDAKQAPKTGGAFVSLVEKRFYDGLTFHRISPGFVIQGGDPSGDGSGGPGYSVVEAPPDDLVYEKGIVAMAKTQIEEAGTSGSQFFVVTAEQADLPPDYALLGKVTKGQDVVDKLGVLPADQSEKPLEPVVIRQIRIEDG